MVKKRKTSRKFRKKLIKFSQRNKPGIIVIGARGLGSFSGVVLGSVSNFVIQKSKIPVIIVK